MTLTWSGPPMAYQRHRVNTRTGHVYNPPAYSRWKTATRAIMAAQWKRKPVEGPVALVLEFSIATRKRERWGKPHTVRPDCDNVVKAVLDCGNGILWADDAQVHRIEARKVWAESGGTFVRLEV